MKFPIYQSTILASLIAMNSYGINGVFDYGMGQINRGMGGAGVALPQDAYAPVINPAGIGLVNHKLDGGAAIYFPMMYSKWGAGTSAFPTDALAAPEGTFHSQTKVFVMPDLGYLYHHDRQNHFGVSINSIGGFGTKYSTNKLASVLGAPATQDGVLGNGTIISDLKIGSLNASYNYFVMPTLSLGLTASYYVQAFKSAGSQGLAAYTQTFLSTGATPTKLSNNGVDYNYGAMATLGALYKFSKELSVAASGTPKVRMTKLHDYKDLLVNHGELDIPAKYSIGLSITPDEQLSVVVDIVRILNEDVGTYGHNSRAIFDGRCAPGSPTLDPSVCLGSKNGPGFGWDNQTILKTGAEYKINSKEAVRLGFSYGNRIGHRSDIVVNTLAPGAAARLITSAGYSKVMPGYVLNTFLTYIPAQTMKGVNELSVGDAQTVKVKVAGVGFGFGVSM